jgi:hypothetical protein
MSQPRIRAPRLHKEHRNLARSLDDLGFDTGLTEKNHLRLTHRDSGRVIYGSGTPSDFRAHRNLMAQVRRLLKGQGMDVSEQMRC